MFYRPKEGHGLPHNPFNALVTPRPIGWISTRGADGSENLAPYSFFNAVSYVPPQVMFASTYAKADRDGTKDSVALIRETGVFCVNVVEHAMLQAMNVTSEHFPAGVDEFEKAGLGKLPCHEIACSRVEGAPIHMECTVVRIVELPGAANQVVFGEVVGVHIRDDILKDGMIDPLAYQPLARMGYRDYTRVTEVFQLGRPDD